MNQLVQITWIFLKTAPNLDFRALLLEMDLKFLTYLQSVTSLNTGLNY